MLIKVGQSTVIWVTWCKIFSAKAEGIKRYIAGRDFGVDSRKILIEDAS